MCEPEVISRERTCPPPIENRHGRYGDHRTRNAAKMSVNWALESKPEVEIWRRPDFFHSATLTSYSTSNTLQCVSRTVTELPQKMTYFCSGRTMPVCIQQNFIWQCHHFCASGIYVFYNWTCRELCLGRIKGTVCVNHA